MRHTPPALQEVLFAVLTACDVPKGGGEIVVDPGGEGRVPSAVEIFPKACH
jgi:hypothetical protein